MLRMIAAEALARGSRVVVATTGRIAPAIWEMLAALNGGTGAIERRITEIVGTDRGLA